MIPFPFTSKFVSREIESSWSNRGPTVTRNHLHWADVSTQSAWMASIHACAFNYLFSNFSIDHDGRFLFFFFLICSVAYFTDSRNRSIFASFPESRGKNPGNKDWIPEGSLNVSLSLVYWGCFNLLLSVYLYFSSFLPKTDTCIFAETKWEPLEKRKVQ